MKSSAVSVSLALCLVSAQACDPGGDDDAGTSPPDSAVGTDAGSMDAGSMDAGSTDAGSMDAGSMDAGSMDAGSTDAGSTDASLDGGCFSFDGGDAAAFVDGDVPDGTVVCPGAPALAACPSAVPALDFTLTMTSTTPTGGVSTAVRGRHYVDVGGALTEQRTREAMASVGSDLLRVWVASAPGSQDIYAIEPATPHPMTLMPKARHDVVALTGTLNSLATFPSYAMEMIPCLAAPDTVGCLADGGRFADTGVTEMVGSDSCRVMMWADESLTICVPADCDARRTLYPYWIHGPSGITVDFTDPAPATHDDVVVVEPAPCETVVGGLVLCDHPDL